MSTVRLALLLSSHDAEARTWRNAVMSNGGSVSGLTMNAVSRFCRQAKSAGIWDKLTRVNLMCGDQLAAAQVPLKTGGGGATETLTNIVAGDYVETGPTAGIKGNGTDKHFSPGWNPVTRGASVSSYGLWAYVKGTESAGASRAIMGHQAAAGEITLLGWAVTGSVEVGGIGAASGTEFAPGGTPAAKEGFLGVANNGSRATQYYQNGAAVGSPVTGTQVLNNSNMLVLAHNNNGTPVSWSTRYLRAYAITTGMSAAEASAFNSIMQQFQAALGRQV